MKLSTNEASERVLDALEFARGTLASLAYLSPSSAQEVHISRIRSHFERAGIEDSALRALEIVQVLGEARKLHGGYWMPTPLRKVRLGEVGSLLLGVQPTNELRRHFPGVWRVGAGRLCSEQQLSVLPEQSLQSWLCSDGEQTHVLAQRMLNLSASQLRPSIASTDLQMFGIKTISVRGASGYGPVWHELGNREACFLNGISLFRQKLGPTHFRYFLGRWTGQRILEGPIVEDTSRMQLGFAELSAKRLAVEVRRTGARVTFRLPVRPPFNLRPLLVALCEEEPSSFGFVWACPDPAIWGFVRSSLSELPCVLIDR